jgi:hypothetical protein
VRNKGQGLIVSTVIAAGLLLRPAASVPPEQNEPAGAAGVATPSTAPAAAGEGPWIASCNYWAPARLPGNPSGTPAEIHNTVHVKDSDVDLHLSLEGTSSEHESGCGGEAPTRWGFPAIVPINVTAIIATVPDPVHSHLSLTFDRTVSAILQAAADNGYISSYYWLPWKNRLGHRLTEAPGDAEPGHDAERERKPGLIILKHFLPDGGENGSPRTSPTDSFDNVVYLFLVAETPTQGVDGFQLQYAFSYEDELEQALKGRGNFSRGRHRVALIGPIYSGSAASLRAGILAAQAQYQSLPEFEVSAATFTRTAIKELTIEGRVTSLSFGSFTDYETRKLFADFLASGYDLGRVALLIEDNTAFGSASVYGSAGDAPSRGGNDVQVIRFPREISLLRNAQMAGDHSGGEGSPSGSVPSPFLHFSLKDSSAQDSVPQFSRENTPVSQEAQLMTIGRQLHRFRTQFIAIVASNVLDQVFLAQFLHRACPDARLVFLGGDVLMVREIDNVPFIGSVTVTPYSLMGLGRVAGRPGRAYPDSTSLATYNAASYTFWHNYIGVSSPTPPALQSYHDPLAPPAIQQPSLWAILLGSDGYYPLGILSPCASDHPQILPAIEGKEAKPASCDALKQTSPEALKKVVIFPARLWQVLCVLVIFLCAFHTLILVVAGYWSPLTRDLAIGENDQPQRRSTYVHIATAVLFSMAWVVSFPAISVAWSTSLSLSSEFLAAIALILAGVSVWMTFRRTWAYIGWKKPSGADSKNSAGFRQLYNRAVENVYVLLNLFPWAALVGLPVLWSYLCLTESASDKGLSLVGLSFSYRSINPGSGVSPVVPILLLLLSWYLWAFFQTWRLRFSENGRPWLPGKLGGVAIEVPLFVSDNDLESGRRPRDTPLYRKITCPMITREMLYQLLRFVRQPEQVDWLTIDMVAVAVYVLALALFSQFTPIDSPDHFLWKTGNYRSSPYEMLVALLSFPLIVMGMTGCFRLVLVWGGLKSDLLERLENLPIRFAFSRLKVTGWMAMLRHGGLQEQWNDMARSLESMRQMLHQGDITGNTSDWNELNNENSNLLGEIGKLLERMAEKPCQRKEGECDYDLMKNIEKDFAGFSQKLLTFVLIPYWKDERVGLVASDDVQELPIRARRLETHLEQASVPMELHAGSPSEVPQRILVAEEFLAIRYISLIRAVLSNMRYLMMFVTASFVLAMVAWNSYPFQPRQWVDWMFTGFLLALGTVVIWVFAQMHRNAILSRITNTRPNELGWDFYLRIASYGALPVLAWLTYQFPDIGSIVSKFLEPAVPVIK